MKITYTLTLSYHTVQIWLSLNDIQVHQMVQPRIISLIQNVSIVKLNLGPTLICLRSHGGDGLEDVGNLTAQDLIIILFTIKMVSSLDKEVRFYQTTLWLEIIKLSVRMSMKLMVIGVILSNLLSLSISQ